MAIQANPYGRYGSPQLNLGGSQGGVKVDEFGRPIYDPGDPDGKISQKFKQDAAQIAYGGDDIINQSRGITDYSGQRQVDQAGLSDEALQQLRETPGYNADEASRIGTDYGQYRTTADQERAQLGDPSIAWKKAEEGNANVGAMLNQYQSNLGGQFQNYGDQTRAGIDQYSSALQDSLGGLDSKLEGAQDYSKLYSAVNDPSLGFDPNSTMKQLSDADVQGIRDAAGRRVGNSYRSAQDDLVRMAAADGNASPLAIAAARARLEARSAADMGDAEADANIKALQAQYDRASGIEGQRLGATQTQAGMRANAATTEQAQRQAAAGLSGTTGVQAADSWGSQALDARQKLGQAGLDTANQYGQYSTSTAGEMGDRSANAAAGADDRATSRATTVNTQRYGQGVDTAAANAQGQQTLGNARIAGQGAYRTGVADQQSMAQQGAQKGVDQQTAAYGTKIGGLNSNTGNRANYENTGPGALGKMGGQLLNAAVGVASPVATALKHADGGTITEPEMGVVGEAGPEMVYGRYGKSIVDEPTLALMEAGDKVVPMNNNPKNKASMRYC